jgi:hypothetical protein
MKKHVFGFALFSFIVAVAVVIGNLPAFEPANVHLTDSYEEPQPRHFCSKKKPRSYDFSYAKIEQIVFDVKTKQMKIAFSPQMRSDDAADDKSYTLRLHYFVKNGSETSFLKTQDIYVKSALDAENEWILTSSLWLDNLESYDNLYIVPEIKENVSVNSFSVKHDGDESSRKNYESKKPRFDYATAVPVLLSRGKDF